MKTKTQNKCSLNSLMSFFCKQRRKDFGQILDVVSYMLQILFSIQNYSLIPVVCTTNVIIEGQFKFQCETSVLIVKLHKKAHKKICPSFVNNVIITKKLRYHSCCRFTRSFTSHVLWNLSQIIKVKSNSDPKTALTTLNTRATTACIFSLILSYVELN